jgi:hypothetical protein
MIQINLLADNIRSTRTAGTTSKTQAIPVLPTDPFLDLGDEGEAPRKSRLPLVLGIAAVIVAGGAAGAYFLLHNDAEPALPAPTAMAKVDKPLPKPMPVPAPPKADSVPPAKDTAKPVPEPQSVAKPETKPAPLPPPPPAPEPMPVAKTEAKPAAPSASGPSVHAPNLPPDALGEILSRSRAVAAPQEKPNRFDALTPAGRTAYQKFAFERILAILRQVTPTDGLGFSKLKIASPGLLSVQGVATKPEALTSFQRGLAAQSLADTSTATGKDQAFALVARLPFNPSFGGLATPATDVRKALQQALDLAAPQGLVLKASAARNETAGAANRTSWTLTGQGGWDAVASWLAALQSAASPIGFTELTLAAGDKGRLQVTVTAVCYGP